MSGRHTPGAWQVRSSGGGFVGTKTKLVASVYGNDPECEDDDCMRANALLIAAAPDMLKALQAIAELPAHPMRKKAVELARAAIAKALGSAA
jgi:hypothetical protein